MANNKFEFEAAYRLLENKLEELRQLSETLECDFSNEIANVEKRISQLRAERYKHLTPWEQVILSRDLERPMTRDYIDTLCTDFIELHGDRLYGDDPAIVGGIAVFGDRAVTVIGQQKGQDTAENIRHNFGMPRPEGFRKAHRLLKNAERFQRPVITFINTPGADPGIGAEERGQAWAISQLLLCLSSLRVPVVSVITGEGGSGGALALTIADRIIMLSNAVFSVASPETCASILLRDVKRAGEMAEALKLNAPALKDLRIIDAIVDEPLNENLLGAPDFVADLRSAISKHLDEVSAQPLDDLIRQRYQRLRVIGQFYEPDL
ncbi:MAG: acetyl-CoA carboxylase carboxyltransferase subunit alpha [Syntrophomonadaceae bacterium]|nr:acetyl-CoA carboxylase carboxyltransferase subunit alpha [Syntrophomonadaceae bacterium]